MKAKLVGAVVAVFLAVPIFSLGAQAADPTRYVSTAGTDNLTCDREHPCRHIEHTVNVVATSGDTVVIEPGTYEEQVTVSAKNLTIRGTSRNGSIIKAPAVKTIGAGGTTFVVELNAAASVRMRTLTVEGPGAPGGGADCGPNPLSLDTGINVVQGSTLALADATVRDIYDIPTGGCQRGTAISIGSSCFSCTPDVGHAVIADSLVTRYQKNGVAVRGAGSTLGFYGNQVSNQPSSVIASNGVEVLKGAAATLVGNRIDGNECNLAVICGADPNSTQGSGILVSEVPAGTIVAGNVLTTNDLGIYTDSGITIRSNHLVHNRYEGIFIDSTSGGSGVLGNVTDRGNYGIYVASGNAGGNRFERDSAHGNSIFDMYWGGGAPSTFKDNSCDTAAPSRSFWDCDGSGGDQGGGGGDQGGGASGAAANRNSAIAAN